MVAQMVKRLSTMWETGFEPWVGKILWRRKWQSIPVLLPGKSHGQRSLVGYSLWGRKEWNMTERLHFHFQTYWRAPLGGATGKEPACQCRRQKRMRVPYLDGEGPLKEGLVTHFIILAWRIPWKEEPGRLWSIGSQRVKHDWSNLASMHASMFKAL